MTDIKTKDMKPKTVKADKYKEVWNTNVEMGEKPPLVQIMNVERNKDTLQVGDEICVEGDTTECFNFIGYDGNNIQPGEEGIQNSLAIGWNDDFSNIVNNYYPATVNFSGTNYWADGSNLKSKYGSDWYNSNIYDPNYSEATDSSIGCSKTSWSCPTTGFITNTSFWFGSASDSNYVWRVFFGGGFSSDDFDYFDYNYGVRPVIEIPTSEIK